MKRLAVAFRVLAILTVVGGAIAFFVVGGAANAVLPALWYLVGGIVGAMVFEAIYRILNALQTLLDRGE